MWAMLSFALLVMPAESAPVRVFILAGQSNMEGQAVVDLAGRDYNEGKGTLSKLLENPEKAKRQLFSEWLQDRREILNIIKQQSLD